MDLNEHDLDVARELGEHKALLAAIVENTKCLPGLVRKVDRHDTQLSLIWWLGGGALTGIGTLFVDWIKQHFFTK